MLNDWNNFIKGENLFSKSCIIDVIFHETPLIGGNCRSHIILVEKHLRQTPPKQNHWRKPTEKGNKNYQFWPSINNDKQEMWIKFPFIQHNRFDLTAFADFNIFAMQNGSRSICRIFTILLDGW